MSLGSHNLYVRTQAAGTFDIDGISEDMYALLGDSRMIGKINQSTVDELKTVTIADSCKESFGAVNSEKRDLD